MSIPSVVTVPSLPVDPAARSSRARVPLVQPPGLLGKAIVWFSRRTFGQVPDPALALGHHRRALLADLLFERRVDKFRSLDPQLKQLATLAAAVQIECSWCLDFGYYKAHHDGANLAKLEAIPHWRDSDLFTDLERRVLSYAEAVTATPPTVDDDLAASLRKDLGDAGLVELTMMVAVENLRSRVNASLGLASQGFAESCRVPAAPRP